MEINKKNQLIFITIILFVFSTLFISTVSNSATITIVNGDSAGEGLNDTSPYGGAPGNPASTVGQARINAFNYAAQLLGDVLESSVEIEVLARFDSLFCSSTSATLGSAGARTSHQNFTNAPIPNTAYPQALANALAGSDLHSFEDIQATFNSELDGSASCLGGAEWYYGTDADPDPGTIDFVTTAIHEIIHGLGFSSRITSNGSILSNIPAAYDRFLVNSSLTSLDTASDTTRSNAIRSVNGLLWDGSSVSAIVDQKTAGTRVVSGNEYIRMYAPNPYEGGSSVSHYDTAVSPNEIMEPSLVVDDHDLTFSLALLEDIGWTISGGFLLTVSKSGAGSGTVTSSPSGINCGTDCSQSYDEDTVVQLTASPGGGSVFSSWSGDCGGTNAVVNVTMSEARSCTAIFSTSGGGSQNVAVNGTASQSSTGFGGSAGRANDGNTNGNWGAGSVTHTQNDGFPYSWWQVDLGASFQVDSVRVWNRTDCCTSRLSSFHVFVSENPFTSNNISTIQNQPGVTDFFVNSLNGQNSITINTGSVNGRYVRVQLSGQNYLTLAEVEVFGTDSGTPPPVTHDLDVNLQGTGTGTVTSSPSGINCGTDCFQSYDEDTVVQLTASPGSGSVFSSWSGDCGGTNAVVNVTMSQARSCTASFNEEPGSIVNLSVSGTASQSSTGFGGSAGRANDGNTNGNWGAGSVSHTQNDGFPYSWWQVDLGDLHQIEEITIWNRTNCCQGRLSNFYVFVSENPFTSNNISTIQNQSGVTDFFVQGLNGQDSITLDAGSIDGRYIRVQLSGQNYLHMAEVEVFGFD